MSDFDTFRHYLGLDTIEDALIALFSLPHSQANLIILHYKTLLQEASLKSATINRRLSALRSLVKTAIENKITPWKLDIENERIENGNNKAGPGKHGVKRILKASKKQNNHTKAARDYAIIRLLHDLALKRSSVVNLDYSDVNLEKGTICVKISCKIERTKSLPTITKRALINWMDVSNKNTGPLFTNFDHAEKGNRLTGTSVYRIVRHLGNEIGIQTGPN
ncbi:tyrosine-type recombinase/integrase, partial [bacterium]|nr:tyrosine-type recombinase/integrase [bacterium]